MKWFYAKDGQQTGPVEFSEIESLYAAGQLTGDSMVWEQGSPNWVKLSTVLGGTGVTGPASLVTDSPLPGVPALSPGQLKPDYGDFLCWGFIAILIPCAGLLVYIALIVLNCMEFFEARKAVAEGKLSESDYSKIHPALFILGFICCGGLLYPLFMHYRNKSGYFKPQPHAVLVSIIVIVISIGFGIVSAVMQVAASAATQGISG